MSPTRGHLTTWPRRRLLLSAGLTAVIVLTSAGPNDPFAAVCRGTNAVPPRAKRHEIARAIRCLINAERRSRGLRSLRPSARLSEAARRHSRDMVRRHYFSHTAPGGLTLPERIRRTGYMRAANDWFVGETLAWGTEARGTARSVVRAWMHSPQHRRVMMGRSFRDLGVGVARGVPYRHLAGGATYAVDFGVRR
jgi:uncharacterized protein YkwD